jgi:HSP20 family protein
MKSFYRPCGAPPQFSSGQPRGNEGTAPPERDDAAPVEPWSPRVNVRESGDSILISVDLPGVRKEDLRVKAGEEGIDISGERRTAGESVVSGTDPCYRIAASSRSGFHRIIPLPQTALIEAARAGLHGGVLEITIPLQRNRRSRQIEIEC